MDIIIIILNIIVLIAIGLIALLWKKSLSSYLLEKGKNLATKEDISEITHKVEEVKSKIQNQQDVEKQKRQLKYDALLNSLTLIDAHLSHYLKPSEGQKIKKQFASVEEARKCHNNLILTCEDKDILESFSLIMFGANEGAAKTAPTDLLNSYRNLVRKELGFGNELDLDREKAWFGYVNFELTEKNPTEV